MRRRTRLHTGSRRARDGIDTDIMFDKSQLSSGEQTKLDAGREAAGVGNVHRRGDLAAVDLRETIDEVVGMSCSFMKASLLP